MAGRWNWCWLPNICWINTSLAGCRRGYCRWGEWNQKKLLLVEGAGIVQLPGFYDMLGECFEAGYTPVIAHPERYPYLEKNDCIKLKERGCLFQLNIPSLHGYYGKHVRQAAFTLLDRGDVRLCRFRYPSL